MKASHERQRITESCGQGCRNCRKLARATGRPEQFIKLDYKPWNPLSSDGDALRLVMRLGLDLLHDASSVTVRKYDNVNQRMMCEITEHGDPVTGEPARRAITRAAAEIGRTHP